MVSHVVAFMFGTWAGVCVMCLCMAAKDDE